MLTRKRAPAPSQSLPVMIGGATTDIAVTIRPAQPDTGYAAEAFPTSGGAILANVEVLSITKTSKSVATVRVRNTGLAALSGMLFVHVTAPITVTPAK